MLIEKKEFKERETNMYCNVSARKRVEKFRNVTSIADYLLQVAGLKK